MRLLPFLFLCAACTPTTGVDIPNDTNDDETDTDTDTDADADTDTTDSDTDTDTDTDPTTPLIEFDCSTIPAQPIAQRQVPGARGYHDVAFHEDGTIFGSDDWDNSAVVKADFAGNVSIFAPPTETIQQIVELDDGDFAVANSQRGIQRLDQTTGGLSTIYGNVYAYGLIKDPNGMLWAADEERLWRVDPNTGNATEIMGRNVLARGAPRVIAFNLDYTKLYMGTRGGSQGRIYAVDLDANYDLVGQPYEFSSGVGDGDYHDTMGVDICGNLYVADFWTASMHRIDRTGNRTGLIQWQFSWNGPYGHGLEFGTGEDGWLVDAIYLSQPYSGNTVLEVDVGVPSRNWTEGYAINLP